MPTPKMLSTRIAGLLVACAMAAAAAAPATAQSAPRKLFISVDMEGIAGVVTGEELGPAGFEYGRARAFMTDEVLAAIRGARAAGVTEIVVADAHGNGMNLLLERLPDDVTVVRSWPRPLMMMEGIDSTFDAALLLGYHASATSPEGVRAHTISSARLADLRLNGRSIPEAGLSAAIAGHFGVPVVFISGDDAAVREAEALLGDIEGAVVKWNLSYHAARTLTPAAATALIEERVRTAVARAGAMRPFTVRQPVTLEVQFQHYRPAQLLAYLPIIERPDARSIRYVGQDIVAVSRFLEFVMSYEVGLEP